MRTRVRQLDDADLSQTIEFLSRAPVANVFLLSRIRQGGLDSARLGCPVHGVFRGGELVGLVHIGANLVPVIDDGRDSAVVDALASKIGRWRRSSSIMGADVAVLPLYERLAQIGPDTWGRPREVRSCQPLLAMSDRPRVVPDARVVRINERHFEPYFRAAVAMYTEEVGVSPLDPGDGYRRHMLELVRQGRGLGIVDDGDVRWKSDVAVTWGNVCQIQGVWMDPAWRGRAGPARRRQPSPGRPRHRLAVRQRLQHPCLTHLPEGRVRADRDNGDTSLLRVCDVQADLEMGAMSIVCNPGMPMMWGCAIQTERE